MPPKQDSNWQPPCLLYCIVCTPFSKYIYVGGSNSIYIYPTDSPLLHTKIELWIYAFRETVSCHFCQFTLANEISIKKQHQLGDLLIYLRNHIHECMHASAIAIASYHQAEWSRDLADFSLSVMCSICGEGSMYFWTVSRPTHSRLYD